MRVSDWSSDVCSPDLGEWLARVDGLGKGWGSLALDRQTRPQADEPDLWLLFAPIKRTRIDFLVPKAADLGVGALVPVPTAHTDVARVNPRRPTGRASRWERGGLSGEIPVVGAT